MKTRDVTVIVAVAAATMLAALALGRAVPGAIANDQSTPAAPTLESEGVVLTLTPAHDTCKVGERPVVTLAAVNPQDQSAEVHATVTMTTAAPPSPAARMMPVPTKVWSTECKAILAPGETRAFELTADVAVQPGKEVSFIVQAGDKRMRVAAVTAPVPGLPLSPTLAVQSIQ